MVFENRAALQGDLPSCVDDDQESSVDRFPEESVHNAGGDWRDELEAPIFVLPARDAVAEVGLVPIVCEYGEPVHEQPVQSVGYAGVCCEVGERHEGGFVFGAGLLGHDEPFEVEAVCYGERSRTNMGQLSWEDVAFFENRDYLTAKYKEVTCRDLSFERAIQIIANLRQGREYFIAAKNAAPLVRPLLIYYGMLSLSRAIVLFRTGKDEATLGASHGLTMCDWAPIPSSFDRVSINLLAMKCRIFAKGTFRDLLDATNFGRYYVAVPPMGRAKPRLCQRHFPVRDTATGTVISFGDVASRIALLGGLYQDILKRNNNVYGVHVFTLEQHTDFSVYPYVPAADEPIIRRLFNVPDTIAMHMDASLASQYGPNYIIRKDGPPETLSDVPFITYGDDSRTLAINSLIRPLEGLGDVSVLGMLFLFAYFGGMLVRYKPSAWYSLNSKLRGDAAFPILQTGLEVIEDILPGYVADEFAIPADVGLR